MTEIDELRQQLSAANARISELEAHGEPVAIVTRLPGKYASGPTLEWLDGATVRVGAKLYLRAPQAVPEGWKLLKDSTPAERDWPEDSSHENGNYYNLCCHCGRQFTGHKRRAVCKVCAAAPSPEGEKNV